MDYSKLTLGDALAEFGRMPHITVKVFPPTEDESRTMFKITIAEEALPADGFPRGARFYIDSGECDSRRVKVSPGILWRGVARTLFERGADLKAYPQMADDFERRRLEQEKAN